MKSLFTLLIFILSVHIGQAQFTIQIDAIPPYYTPLLDDLYLSGDLNSWTLLDNTSKFTKQADGTYQLVLNGGTNGSTYEYKINRGDWANVETNLDGSFLPNRTFTYQNGGTENITVWNWEDLLGWHTAVGNTHILDLDFYIPQLSRNRRVWIYLPQSYYTSNQDYPVLYMHDAQNLFDEVYTAFGTEWAIDESMEQLQNDGHPAAIIVGIDHGDGERINEYSPWTHPTYGGGDGGLYTDFLCNTLKPFIDTNFRTKPERENTAIMGSSLGGLISYYSVFSRQDVFAMAGIFSPSFWFSDEVNTFASNLNKEGNMRIYFMAGEQESADMVPDMQTVYNQLLNAGFSNDEMAFETRSDGQHSEWFWAREFYDAYVWLFQDIPTGTTTFTNLNLTLYPNPAQDRLLLNNPLENLKIYRLDGQIILSSEHSISELDISNLAPGYYLLEGNQKNRRIQASFVKLK